MSKYKVGDKVRIVSKWPADGSAAENSSGHMDKWLGKVMTIRTVMSDDHRYRMEEDQHDRNGLGWLWNDACIAGLQVSQKILVVSDGKTTTAKLFNGKELVKSAEAKCSPSDEFDFEKGAALAVDRLLGRTVVVAEAPKFTKDDLKTGMFGRMSDGRWFVVLGDRLLYGQQDGGIHSGGFDFVKSLSENLGLLRCSIDFVVEACSFRNAHSKANFGQFVWKRPGVNL